MSFLYNARENLQNDETIESSDDDDDCLRLEFENQRKIERFKIIIIQSFSNKASSLKLPIMKLMNLNS